MKLYSAPSNSPGVFVMLGMVIPCLYFLTCLMHAYNHEESNTLHNLHTHMHMYTFTLYDFGPPIIWVIS